MPTWCAIPGRDEHHDIDALVDNPARAADTVIAMIETFGTNLDVSYPCALNAVTWNVERGGPMEYTAAKAWCERVAGLRRLSHGDERPPFYYRKG